jgi:hypothetical protein
LGFVFIFIILLIILLAFADHFGNFPDSWAWIGIILAGLGVIMTAPTIFQMIWGKPRVDISFEDVDDPNGKSLQVFFNNPPVRNKLLRFLGVRRETVQSLTVQFRISEPWSGKILVPIHQGLIYTDEVDVAESTCKGRISLPPTFSVGATTMIIMWQDGAYIPPDRLRQPRQLTAGIYEVLILFLVDGEPRQVSRLFTVGTSSTDLQWSRH